MGQKRRMRIRGGEEVGEKGREGSKGKRMRIRGCEEVDDKGRRKGAKERECE